MPEIEQCWANWMRCAIAGDDASYRRLLEAVSAHLRAFVRRQLAGSPMGWDQAEDIVQESLLAIHLKRHTWDASRPIVPWVHAIARHKAIDAARRRVATIHLPIDDFVDVLPAPRGDDASESTHVLQLLARMPERQRSIIQYVSIEGRSAQEVAALLGMTEGAVRVILHRALKRLAIASKDETT